MPIGLVAAGAILPAVVLLLLLNRGRRPLISLVVGSGAGFLIGMPAAFVIEMHLQPQITNLASFLLFCFLVAGGVEELCKLAAYSLVPARTRWLQNDDDVVLYAGAVALGFAAAENILYCVHEHDLVLWRAFTAVPAHLAFGIVMGYGLTLARRQRDATDGVLRAWLAASICHGIYDAVAFQLPGILWTTLALLALLALRLLSVVHARAEMRWLPPRPACIPDGAARSPIVAAICGVFPGGGQLYNRQPRKGGIFFLVAVLNAALAVAAHQLATAPGATLLFLLRHGLAVPAHIGRLSQQLGAAWPWLAGLTVSWIVLGAIDAWHTAAQRRRREEPTMLTGSAAAYALHAILVPLLLLVPIAVSTPASSQSGGRPIITRVEDPKMLLGNHAGLEGTHPHPQMLDKTPKPTRLARLTPPHPADTQPPAPARTPQPEHTTPQPAVKMPGTEGTEPAQQHRVVIVLPPPVAAHGPDVPTAGDQEKPTPPPMPSGTPLPDGGPTFKSYHEYLSGRLREPMMTVDGIKYDGYYFANLRHPEEWTIVRYRIRYDGQLLSVQLVDTSGQPDEARKAVEVIEAAAPFLPLPEGVQEIEVTELFWNQQLTRCPPGSLAERLSEMDDGRSIIATPSPGTRPESAP